MAPFSIDIDLSSKPNATGATDLPHLENEKEPSFRVKYFSMASGVIQYHPTVSGVHGMK
jgi:hypothetical protein